MSASEQLAITTHVLAATALGIGLVFDLPVVGSVGAFALAGSITNAIAIHLIFEKVPGIIGSGVILSRFEAIREAVADLIMVKLFTDDALKNLSTELATALAGNAENSPDDKDPADRLFDRLVTAVENSSLGSLMAMAGGAKVLEPLRPHLAAEVQDLLDRGLDSVNLEQVRVSLTTAVRKRLAELTPDQVKDLLSELIRKYLGWLVVWGGFFGGVIGGIWFGVSEISATDGADTVSRVIGSVGL